MVSIPATRSSRTYPAVVSVFVPVFVAALAVMAASCLERSTTVTFATHSGPVMVEVEVVSTEEDRREGLMFRESLPEDEGMLFVWEENDTRWFWMRNTLIPLDMIFIASDGTVTGIVEDAVPGDETPVGGYTARYVVEVNAGFASGHGIVTGTRVRIE